MQLDIFDMMYPQFKINKEIALIEFFGGYGSQALGLKYANIPFRHHKLCEWAINSIQAYKDIHFTDDDTDYSKGLSEDEIKEFLFNKGISKNWNEPMTREQIDRLKENEVRTIYNNIKATHNLVNIQYVKGEDLEINDKEHLTYLLTYSFPCQDISICGLKKGFEDTSTRSGMLWEVERILKELKDKPDVLLMENVPLIHSNENLPNFIRWMQSLEEMGYKNYFKDMVATDYGIPQMRNRTFMVSILGNYKYTFPEPIPLKVKLKDLLEDIVDEKYYLNDKQIQDIQGWKSFEKPLENMERNDRNNIAPTLTTRTSEYTSSMILVKDKNTKNMYSNEEIKLFTKDGNIKRYVDSDIIDVFEEGQMATTTFPNGYGHGPRTHNESVSLNTIDKPSVKKGLRIRKLTPKECFRLQGVKDEDFNKCQKNQTDMNLYHLAGDSIVVDILKYIFLNMI